MGCLGYILLFILLMAAAEILGVLLPYIGIVVLIFLIYCVIKRSNPVAAFKRFKLKRFEKKYYASEEFLFTKQRVEKYIKDCNELNEHILELRSVRLGTRQIDYGKSSYYDTSGWDFSRPEYKNHSQSESVYNCSRTVCDNARMQPFKYVCKYFDLKPTEEVLEKFENLLNNFEAAKEGQGLLEKEKWRILHSIDSETPPIIKEYGMEKFQRELGFRDTEFEELEFPHYTFQYVSPGGNASTRCDVVMDIDNLNRFIKYLSENIKFRQSVAGQRALMTSALRRKILNRDNCTCQKCQNSTRNEPNLLLEIDHIMPLSKGGLTTEENLQVLCWRCNRRKGSKII